MYKHSWGRVGLGGDVKMGGSRLLTSSILQVVNKCVCVCVVGCVWWGICRMCVFIMPLSY